MKKKNVGNKENGKKLLFILLILIACYTKYISKYHSPVLACAQAEDKGFPVHRRVSLWPPEQDGACSLVVWQDLQPGYYRKDASVTTLSLHQCLPHALWVCQPVLSKLWQRPSKNAVPSSVLKVRDMLVLRWEEGEIHQVWRHLGLVGQGGHFQPSTRSATHRMEFVVQRHEVGRVKNTNRKPDFCSPSVNTSY